MNPWLDTLTETLRTEGILSDPEKSRLVPAQYYADTLREWAGQLEDYLRARCFEKRDIALFVDGVTKGCSESWGRDVDGLFCEAIRAAGFTCELIDLSARFGIRPGDLHASHRFVEKARRVVRSLSPAVFAVLGSGSITDIVKQALFAEGREGLLISVPTALTVTAFTSCFSVIDRHGAKRTQLSREINATFWIESILERAPGRMSGAGYGDLLARFVAYGDWYLGKSLGMMERYDECALRLMDAFAAGIKENASGFSLPHLPVETIRCISASLAMAGIAMSVSGETTPLSGFEHVISHGLDFLRLTSGRELAFHGEQVALACPTNARAMDWLLGRESIDPGGWLPDPVRAGLSMLGRLIDTAPFQPSPHLSLAELTDRVVRARREFIAEYEKKSARWEEEMRGGRIAAFVSEWPEIKKNLARITLRAPEIRKLMERAGLPLAPEETLPPTSSEEYRFAVRFSPFVRSRMNTADLIFWMGEDITQFI
jgi:glycerol-1-phosphate dehydrogenase [NAD(P)+]